LVRESPNTQERRTTGHEATTQRLPENHAIAVGEDRTEPMSKPESTMTQQVSQAVTAFQQEMTGHAPKAVTVILNQDTLVVMLQEALSPAEKDLAKTPTGAAMVREFYRHLFSNSSQTLWEDIKRITGMEVLEAVAEVLSVTGAVVYAFAMDDRSRWGADVGQA
jgi:uncharacterized protein YbcI